MLWGPLERERMGWTNIADVPPPWVHAVCAMVDIGTILLPGNMGRIVSLYSPNSPRLHLENDFDAVRMDIDQNIPSRLSSIFLCLTLRDALAFAATDAPKFCQWYEVVPVQPVKPVFISDIRDLVMPSTEDDNRKAATRYWTGDSAHYHREILFPGPVKVKSLLPPIIDIAQNIAQTERERTRLQDTRILRKFLKATIGWK